MLVNSRRTAASASAGVPAGAVRADGGGPGAAEDHPTASALGAAAGTWFTWTTFAGGKPLKWVEEAWL